MKGIGSGTVKAMVQVVRSHMGELSMANAHTRQAAWRY
jgi:hypothetical protein